MPVLARLRAQGVWTSLRGPARQLEGSCATTLHSGLPPGEHGVYHPFAWSAERQRLRLRERADMPEAVWTRLGRAGRRTLLIDPYDWVRERGVAGVVAACGVQFTNRVVLPRWACPPSTGREIARRFGRSPRADETFGGAQTRELLRLRRALVDAPMRAARATRTLLAEEGRFDLAWVELLATHVAGHQLWDPASAASDIDSAAPAVRTALARGLADVYEASDRALGEVVAALPEDGDLIVMTATGMAAETDRSDLLPAMLDSIVNGRGNERRSSGALWSVRAAVRPRVRERAALAIPDRLALELTARLPTAGADWRRARAVAVPNEPCGAVRLNVSGRERKGIVSPADVDDLAREIERGLLSFRDPDGGAAVTAVDRIHAIEHGPRAHLLPDLGVRWSEKPATAVDRLESTEYGEVRRLGRGSGRSGNHRYDGWALLVPRRSRVRTSERPAELVDVAATACAVLGADDELHALPGEPLLTDSG